MCDHEYPNVFLSFKFEKSNKHSYIIFYKALIMESVMKKIVTCSKFTKYVAIVVKMFKIHRHNEMLT
jgi:MinD superfamily P-loop ATPase